MDKLKILITPEWLRKKIEEDSEADLTNVTDEQLMDWIEIKKREFKNNNS